MPINVETFLSLPDLADKFKNLNRSDLSALAQHFEMETMNMKKSKIKTLVENKLINDGFLEVNSATDEDISNDEQEATTSGDQMIKMRLELKKLELQEKKEERAQRAREMEFKRELEFKKMEMEKTKDGNGKTNEYRKRENGD